MPRNCPTCDKCVPGGDYCAYCQLDRLYSQRGEALERARVRADELEQALERALMWAFDTGAQANMATVDN